MDIIHSWAGGLHFVAALLALGLGWKVLVDPKGGRRHRWLGYAYTGCMSALILAGIPMLENGFTAFHALSIVSAVTLAGGISMAIRARTSVSPEQRRGRIFAHYKFMTWSYAGLVAAGVAQMATRVLGGLFGPIVFWWVVVFASLGVCALAAWWIARFERHGLDRYLGRA